LVEPVTNARFPAKPKSMVDTPSCVSTSQDVRLNASRLIDHMISSPVGSIGVMADVTERIDAGGRVP
jgi:hypothetical protein